MTCIYKLVSNNCRNKNCYIGSTINLYKRMIVHNHRNRKGKLPYLYKALDNDFHYEVLEECDVEIGHKDLLLKEAEYIRSTPNCVNKQIPFRTKKEWTLTNRDKVLEQRRKRRLINRDHINNLKKINYHRNKEKKRKETFLIQLSILYEKKYHSYINE